MDLINNLNSNPYGKSSNGIIYAKTKKKEILTPIINHQTNKMIKILIEAMHSNPYNKPSNAGVSEPTIFGTYSNPYNKPSNRQLLTRF